MNHGLMMRFIPRTIASRRIVKIVFYDYPIEDEEETEDGLDNNEALFKMGNSKHNDGNSMPKDPMPVDLNQPLEEKDTIDENKGKAPMCLPYLLLGQPQQAKEETPFARARMWIPTLERIWDDKFEEELKADPALFVKALFDLRDAYDLLEIRVEDLKYVTMKKDKALASTSQLPQQYTTESLQNIIKNMEARVQFLEALEAINGTPYNVPSCTLQCHILLLTMGSKDLHIPTALKATHPSTFQRVHSTQPI
ncbi:hypothetical protein ACH5RR_023152 [Cinchona calisaya]|uniref:Uncharacterized protein n=1 Tax=Cinchona calisaya TaxID=153742 RepID=A0ABD2ZD53_9GENT